MRRSSCTAAKRQQMPRNPYLNRSMIRAVDQFFGRQRPLERVFSRLNAQPPQSVSLVGERRVGKSSLLWHIAQPEVFGGCLEEPERYLFVLLDFQGQQHLDPAGFCRAMGLHLAEAAGGRVEVPTLESLSDIEACVRTLDRAGLRLICLFDEFETVTRNADFGAEFFGFLRALANRYPVAFVTASRRPLQGLCHNQEISESPFFNIFTQVHLGPMTVSEVDALIREPSQQAGVDLVPQREAILALSGYLPFFVQIACSVYFDGLTEAGDGEFPSALARERFGEEAEGHFNYLWDSFDEDERGIMTAVAMGEGEDVPDTSLRMLEADGYIRRVDGQAQPFSVVFGDFVRGRAVAGAKGKSAQGGVWGRWKRWVAAVGAVAVLAGVYTLWPAENGPVLYYQRRAGAGWDEGRLELATRDEAHLVLASGDRFRLEGVAPLDGYLYALMVEANGGLKPLAATEPLPLAAGQRYRVPGAEKAWLECTALGPAEICLLLAPARDLELEEAYWRLPLAAPQHRQAQRERLRQLLAAARCIRLENP